jgi:branched-subunit amino acid ABC-type transport system permease component
LPDLQALKMLPFLIVGLVTGSLYGLAGVGLVLTYRTSGIFNFAHGAIAAAAAFAFHSLHDTHGWPWPIAATVLVLGFGVIVGSALERITVPLQGAPPVAAVVTTVGMFLIATGYLLVTFGDVRLTEPDFLPTSGFRLSNVHVTWAQVIEGSAALLAAMGLYLYMRLSRLGIAMRAVVENPTLVALTAESPAKIRRRGWGIGTAFAAATGILLAPTLGLDATLLTLVIVQAFGACAVGLFKNLPLTFLGGLLVGVLASLSTKYFVNPPWSGIHDAIPFLVLIVVLIAAPTRSISFARAAVRSLAPVRSNSGPRWLRPAIAVAFSGFLISVPSWAGVRLPVWIEAANYAVLFCSLALLTWTSGQISLCHMAFAAVGATTLSRLTADGVPWLPAMLLAGLITAPVGALIAIPAIRLSGIYLGLLTLGFGLLMEYVVYPSRATFGRTLEVQAHRPRLGFIHAADDTSMYYIALACAAIAACVLLLVQRTRLGRLLRALAEVPTMLQTIGLGTNITRLLVYAVSAFLAGIAGALFVTQTGTVAATSFNPIQSLLLVAVLAICGTNPVRSSFMAAGLLALTPNYLRAAGIKHFDADHQVLFFGIAATAAGLLLGARPAVAAWIATAAHKGAERAAHSPVTTRPGSPVLTARRAAVLERSSG